MADTRCRYDERESLDVMTRRFKEFDRSAFFGEVFKVLLPKMHVHMATGDEWHAHRRLMSETMSPAFLNQVAGPQMWSTTQSLIKLWREKARLAEGRPIEFAEDISKGALEVVWAATFGEETGSNRNRADHLAGLKKVRLALDINAPVEFPEIADPPAFTSINTLSRSMDIPVSSPFPALHHWLALNCLPKYITARKHTNAMMNKQLRNAKQKFSSPAMKDDESLVGMKCALDLVIARELKTAEKEGRKAQTDSQTVYDELFGFLIAGHETAATTIGWTLKHLTANQDAQSKLRVALRNSFPNAIGSGVTPSVEAITSTTVPYLEAVIQEAGRIGLAAIASIRIATVDTEIFGYPIPKGTDVFFMHNGPGILMEPVPIAESRRSKTSQAAKGKIPDWDTSTMTAYSPERWLKKDEKGEVVFDSHAGPSTPFGGGPRGCFGKAPTRRSSGLQLTKLAGRKWAMLELRIVLTLIVWNFELQLTPEALSSWRAIDGVTHRPEQSYLRLKAL